MMINYYKMRFFQILETVSQYSISYVIDHVIYFDREAVPVEKDLLTLKPMRNNQQQSELKIVEITPELIESQRLIFTLRNRYLKAMHYLGNGYGGYALVRGDKVCGDVWYSILRNTGKESVHPDVRWLGLQYNDNDVYTFDLYLDQRERGKNLSYELQYGALQELAKKGMNKAFGYFWAKNIPALWVHRMLKWKELKRVKTSRFLIFKWVRR